MQFTIVFICCRYKKNTFKFENTQIKIKTQPIMLRFNQQVFEEFKRCRTTEQE